VKPLVVVANGTPGGSNAVVAALFLHRPEGVDATCVLLEDGPLRGRFDELGAETRVVPAGDALALWRLPGVVWRLRAEIRRTRPDIVFAHGPKAHVYASLAARLCGVPYLWWQHDPPQLKVRRNKLVAHLPAGLVICSSEFVAVEQRRRARRIPVVTVWCGTETVGVPGPREHEAVEGAVVGTVARLQRYKGFERLLRAVPGVLERHPATRFRIVGGGAPGVDDDYEAELHALAAELSVAHAVEFAGHVDDAAARMAELDVLVHCATLEPFGLVLVEAMLRGVPVVADTTGGPREIVRDGTDGLLVPVGDAVRLAEAIAGLVGDPAERARMGAAARERVLERFDARRMAAETWTHAARVAGKESV
jgi:glycosyltransferase involved in cell wall biosynthesis